MFQIDLEVPAEWCASTFRKQVQSNVGRADGIGFLQRQLTALIKSLQGTREGEGQQKAHQRENSTFDGAEASRHPRFLSKTLGSQAPAVFHEDKRANQNASRNSEREQKKIIVVRPNALASV